MHGQDVAIVGGDPVGLCRIALGSDQLDLQGGREVEKKLVSYIEKRKGHSFSNDKIWQCHTLV